MQKRNSSLGLRVESRNPFFFDRFDRNASIVALQFSELHTRFVPARLIVVLS